jgi:FlaA1/EpsC-like NDP-sugar epimerase
MNMLACADECGCDDFVLISTDKAVNPGGVMGCTKRLGEMMLGARPFARMRCISVRFGNVIGSQGSVVPIFQDQIRRGVPVTVTHPEMTRYFMTIPEAAHLLVQAHGVGDHGDILVLDMGEPVRIVDLAGMLIRDFGKSENEMEIQYIGMRAGEKLHEELFFDSETPEPTSALKIQRAKCFPPAWQQLSRELRQLHGCSLSRDHDRIREKLKQIIPEYEWIAPQDHAYSVHTSTSAGVGL